MSCGIIVCALLGLRQGWVSGNESPSRQQLEDKVNMLVELSQRRYVAKLDSKLFFHLVHDAPRNYSVIAMFTALSRKYECPACPLAHVEFEKVASSHRYSEHFKSNKLFFVMLDVSDALDIFHLLDLNRAPAFFHFPATEQRTKADRMIIELTGFPANAIARWVEKNAGVAIAVVEPINYRKIFEFILVSILAGGIWYLQNATVSALFILLYVFTMISGQLWNYVNKPPLNQKTDNNKIVYFAQSQAQFVHETYLVVLIYASIVTGMILLIESGKNKKFTRYSNRVLACVGLTLVAFCFSLILSIFGKKSGGYPYTFLMS